jgi:DNA-binding transcriptional LysR family regulator
MDFEQLRTFLAIVEHGSFSAAARALRIGQSTVSFHIQALERSLGTRVLDRRGAGARPTATGRTLKRYATRLLALRDEASARLADEQAGESGRVAIAASTIPAEYLLPPVLAAFRKAHPRVQLAVEVSDSRRAMARLLAEDCDLALVGAREADARVITTPFAHDEIVLVGPSPNPFAPNGRLDWAGLARVPIIEREDGSGTRQTLLGAMRRSLRTVADAPASIRVGSSEAAKHCARSGLGLAFVSRHAVAEDLAAGRLELVRVPGLPVKRRFHVARLRRVTPSSAARGLAALIVQYYR